MQLRIAFTTFCFDFKMTVYDFALVSVSCRTLICLFLHNAGLKRVYMILFVFISKDVLWQLVYSNDSCIRLIMRENRYFVVDDVPITFTTSVQQ